MAGNQYDIGDLVRIKGSFSIAAVPTDPTVVTVTVKSPSGATSTPAVIHPGVGEFHADVSVNAPGEWFYRISGTGAAQAAGEGSFFVRKSRVL